MVNYFTLVWVFGSTEMANYFNFLWMFENRLLRRICGIKSEEVTGGWRKLHRQDHHTVQYIGLLGGGAMK
jgi:hypothetical protein